MSPPPPGGGSCDVQGPRVHPTPPPPGDGSCDVQGRSTGASSEILNNKENVNGSQTNLVIVDRLLCSILKSFSRHNDDNIFHKHN